MDMNEILAQWDKIQKNAKTQKKEIPVSHKKPNAPTKEEKLLKKEQQFYKELSCDKTTKENKQNPMEMWLEKYGVVDKDKIQETIEEKKAFSNKSTLVNMKPQAIIDLHGLHQDEAYDRLNLFIGDCIRKGLKKVMIIHGKGIHTTGTDPVLGDLVKRFLENDKRCGMFAHPKEKADGGNGATWVILKNN